MPNRYCLSIAGIGLELETEQPLAVEPAFAPFLKESVQTDVCARFSCEDQLPKMTEHICYRDSGCCVCRKASGETIRFFFETPASSEPYGAAWEESSGQIRVVYLPQSARAVSEFGNSFYHLDIERILLRFGRLCFHAACVETELGGILFSGPSGIGKSTQAQLWCKHRGARQINGDRPALSFDGRKWLAWGSPYAGSSKVHVNEKCSVRAIVMLKQEKQCSLRRLGKREAFRAVWQGLAVHSWDTGFMDRVSGLAVELAASVPVFELGCTPDETSVDFLEQKLRKELEL